MMIPTIHLNGTSKEQLLRELEEILIALEGAKKKMEKQTIHGRDYYPQGHEALQAAVKEGIGRFQRLRSITREFEELYEKISEGGAK